MRRMRTALSFLLATALAAGLAVSVSARRFSDVPEDYWAYASIEEAATDGAVQGYADGTYRPAALLTLAHYTVILARSFYADELEAAAGAYPDGPWYAAAEQVARNHGLLTDLSVEMSEPLSRYGMALMVYNLLQDFGCTYPEEAVHAVPVTVGDWQAFPGEAVRNAVAHVYALGILGGYQDGCFHGDYTLNRGQAAAVYARTKAELLRQQSPTDGEPETEDFEQDPDIQTRQEVLRLVNAAREAEGLSPLTLSEPLSQAAQIRAEELPERFDHTRPDGRDCFTILEDIGLQLCLDYFTTGENIAAGQTTPAAVMDTWMNSLGHRENILSAEFGQLGVGVCRGGSYGVYWVQLFTD